MYQYSVLPFGLALAPRTFSKCIDAALSPLRTSGMRILNYLDDWLILAQSRHTLISHIDSLLSSLVVPRAMCQHAEEHSCPESVHNISGNVLRLHGDESPPLVGTCSGHFIFPFPSHFRQGSSVHLKEFQRLLGIMASTSAVCHLGLLHMRSLQLWLKSRVPWTAWTSGRLSIAVTPGCIEALTARRNPDLFSRGVPLGSVASCVVQSLTFIYLSL